MNPSGKRRLFSWLMVLAATWFFAGTAASEKVKDRAKNSGNGFEDIYYLFGPTARQSHDRITGEAAKGALRFDATAKMVVFAANLEPGVNASKDGSSGPGFQVPYANIRKLEEVDESKARTGSWAIGAGAGALLIRKHRHFLLIHYTDENNNNRSALLELDKGRYKDILKTAAEQTGLKVEK
jgi:hypothetical protein